MMDRYPADFKAFNRQLHRARELRRLEFQGVWPQGTRDLYNNPDTATYNRGIARALCRAMTKRR